MYFAFVWDWLFLCVTLGFLLFFCCCIFHCWWFKFFTPASSTEAVAVTFRSMSLIQSTNFPRINPKRAIAIAMAIYLTGSCCWANCGGEYGFWNAADVSFFVASFTIRNRKISSCNGTDGGAHSFLWVTKTLVFLYLMKIFLQQNLFHCRLKNKNLLSVACFLVVADFRHRAIAVLQPKPVQSPMNRVPAKNKCQIKVKANWN